MFIPLSVSTYGRQSPWANFGLIGLCVGGFLLSGTGASESAVTSFALWSRDPSPHQFITHLFLHGDWLHLLGNMMFLWAFGNAVNGKLNHGLFLGFFLLAGIIAGAGELYFSGLESYVTELVKECGDSPFAGLLIGGDVAQLKAHGIPLVGASGAIMGVAGLCMVLFPLNPVRVFILLFFRPIFFEMKAIYLILIYAALDLTYLILYGHTGVAYTAHLAGFAAGVLAGILFLKSGLIERDGYDLLAVFGRGGRTEPHTSVGRLRTVKGTSAKKTRHAYRSFRSANPRAHF